MSNLIKGFSAFGGDVEPYVIDADKTQVGVKLNEQVMSEVHRFGKGTQNAPDADGFFSGISAEELSEEAMGDIVNLTGLSEEEMADSELALDVEEAHEAALVVEEAYEEARSIRAQAEAEAEDIKARSRLEGINEGREQGLSDAAAEMEQMKTQLLEEHEQLKKQLLAEHEQAISELEPQVNEVLCQLLERLTGVVVTGHKEVLMYLINNAMRGIDNSHSFVISLSDGDYAYVNEHKEEIYGYLNPGVEIELFQDSELSKNQCKIETDNGLVDLSLDVQLSQLIKSLMLLNA